jgi:single-strand DNA-binding protein
MYNKVVLVGNLTRDVELRYTQSGSAIGNTGIATNRKWKDQTGQQKEEVMFVDITFFGRSAEIANQYLRKGSKILVDGRLKLEQWKAQDGTGRSKHVVIVETMKMLDGNPNNQNNGQNGNYGGNAPQQNQRPQAGAPQQSNAPQQANAPQPQASIPEIDIDEDEIPF